jgi:hypothetical protein
MSDLITSPQPIPAPQPDNNLFVGSVAPPPAPNEVSATWDPETGTWGIWDNNSGTWSKTGLSEVEAKSNAEEIYDFGYGDDGDEIYDFGYGDTNPPATLSRPPAPPLPTPLPDMRFRLSLAPSSKHFYKASSPGILEPLKQTDGVVFPYMPKISVSYTANYAVSELTHSNYPIVAYKNSNIPSFEMSAEFTAQNYVEANYVLAVIHFLRSATKMFFGQDSNRGTPPPLLYLSGMGIYNFDRHPVVITNFNYTMPDDVDYINAYPDRDKNGPRTQKVIDSYVSRNQIRPDLGSTIMDRLFGAGLKPGVENKKDTHTLMLNSPHNREATRIPTKLTISLSLQPVTTRDSASNKFSLKEYATGALLRGSLRRTGGGMW